ncbi:MAG TPA: nucleotidyltransferase family protein [Terriglobia bacterium]|nr:nucleotidyltransferase family protein [Terriglobia bacterium]
MVLKLNDTRKQIRPEDEVLLLVGRVDKGSEIVERLTSLLQRDLDWEYLLNSARRHGLIPSLHQRLSSLEVDSVPAEAKTQLQDESRALQGFNLLLTREMLRVLGLLEAEGIRAIPFKGPALAMMAYGNLALRQFNDLDFLLQLGDIPRARAVLSLHGYRSQHSLGRVQEDAYLRSLCQLPLLHKATSILVELHSKVTPRDFSFSADQTFWQRLIPVSLLQKEVLTFSREDLLLILCVHGAKHVWCCIGWICDVANLLSVSPGIDWGQVTDQARRMGCERMLRLGLFLAHDLLEAPLPDLVFQEVHKDSVVQRLAERVCKQLFPSSGSDLSAFSNALFHLQVREHLRDGSRYSLSLALAPTLADWSMLAVPARLSFLYYPARFIRLMGKYSKRIQRSSVQSYS